MHPFLRQSIPYFIPLAVQILFAQCSLFIFSRVFSTQEYGVIGMTQILLSLFMNLANWGFINGMVRYLPEPGADRSAILATGAVGCWVSGAVTSLALVALSPRISGWVFQDVRYADLLAIAFLTLLVTFPFQFGQQVSRMEKDSKGYALFDAANVILSFLLSVFAHFQFRAGVLSLFLGPLLSLTVLSLLRLVLGGRGGFGAFSPAVFRKMILYGAPFALINVGTWSLNFSDRFFLSRSGTLEAIGVYHLAYTFGMYMEILVNPFIMNVLPHLFDFHFQKAYAEKGGRLVSHYLHFYSFVLSGLGFLSYPYFHWFLDPKFSSAALFAPFLIFAYAWRGLYNILVFPISVSGDYAAMGFIEWGTALVNILLNIILIPAWGAAGAVGATCLSFLFLLLMGFRYNQRHCPVMVSKTEFFTLFFGSFAGAAFIAAVNHTGWWFLGIAPGCFFFVLGLRKGLFQQLVAMRNPSA